MSPKIKRSNGTFIFNEIPSCIIDVVELVKDIAHVFICETTIRDLITHTSPREYNVSYTSSLNAHKLFELINERDKNLHCLSYALHDDGRCSFRFDIFGDIVHMTSMRGILPSENPSDDLLIENMSQQRFTVNSALYDFRKKCILTLSKDGSNGYDALNDIDNSIIRVTDAHSLFTRDDASLYYKLIAELGNSHIDVDTRCAARCVANQLNMDNAAFIEQILLYDNCVDALLEMDKDGILKRIFDGWIDATGLSFGSFFTDLETNIELLKSTEEFLSANVYDRITLLWATVSKIHKSHTGREFCLDLFDVHRELSVASKISET